jgi:glycosyltransferase involved in cell wall biosynthesis
MISIIVPVYNAGAFLNQCLSSIRAQTHMDWECLCVDDGSTDDSPDIVRAFAHQDVRFRLIEQKNRGPGGARNNGLESAKGEYFTFVDSDDLVHPELLSRMHQLAKSNAADLVVCNLITFKSDQECHAAFRQFDSVDENVEVFKSPLLPRISDWKKFRVHPVGKLYARSTHGGLRFPALYGAEDAYASFDVYGRAKVVVFTSQRLYGYREVEEGLTRSVVKYRNYIEGDAKVAIHCDRVLRQNGMSNSYISQIAMTYVMRIYGYANEMSVDSRLSVEKKLELMELANNGLQSIREQVDGRYRILPLVHAVPHLALRTRNLRILSGWQKLKRLVKQREGMGAGVRERG